MKKRIAWILCFVMALVFIVPAGALAQNDKGLEDAIKKAKSLFTIPAGFTKFTYNIGTDNNRQVWYLDWTTKDGTDGSINVSVDEKGTVRRYSYYKPYDYSRKKLPKVSKQDALKKAKDFIAKVNPNLTGQLKDMDLNSQSSMDYSYGLNFTRLVNGIPFPSDSVSVEVNSQTGEVTSYYMNWEDDLVFPKPVKTITMDQAVKAYKEKLGLWLVYNGYTENESIKTFTVYQPKFTTSYIDAFTGEKTDLDFYYGSRYGMGGGMAATSAGAIRMDKASAQKKEIALSPDEIKAVQDMSKMISQEEAEKKARALSMLQLTDEYKVTANLNKDWSDPTDYIWNISFSKDSKGGTDDYRYVNVSLSAKTGEIKNFSVSYNYKDTDAARYTEQQAKTAVWDFIRQQQPEKSAQLVPDEGYRENYLPLLKDGSKRQYGFRYLRKVNGIPYVNNSITVRYDAVTGQIINYDMSWFNAQFKPLTNVISLENANTAFFKEIGLEMIYVTYQPQDYYVKVAVSGQDTAKPEVRLVYAAKQTKPALFDAYTGKVLNYDGQPYVAVKTPAYTDIAGNAAEKQIKVLAENGIYLEGTQFKPNEAILQKDFFRLLVKALGNYYYTSATTAGDKDLDDLYNYLIREGIVKAAEKAPNSTLTREEAAKFVIRSLKVDYIADLKGIFKCDFADAQSIKPELQGYVTLVNGLKIMTATKGKFNPKTKLTRADAALTVYNYLQR